MRWLVKEANKRLIATIIPLLKSWRLKFDASREKGGAIARRDNSHRMAKANKAFAHFRW